MPITNISKPTTSLTNPTKVVGYETWDSNTTIWDTETRTWNEMGTVWSNTSKIIPTMTAYWKLDETTGDAVDYVNGYILTNTDVTYSSGKINNGGVFNGSSSYLLANSVISSFNNSNFSVAFWVNWSSINLDRFLFSLQNVVDTRQILRIATVSNFIRITRYLNDNTFNQLTIPASGSIRDGLWHHIVFTFNIFDGYKGYIDGSLDSSSNSNLGTGFVSNAILSIGARGNTTAPMFPPTSQFFVGSLDEIGLWNTTLSQDDVTYLYNSTAGRQPPYSLAYSNIINTTKP